MSSHLRKIEDGTEGSSTRCRSALRTIAHSADTIDKIIAENINKEDSVVSSKGSYSKAI